ncbi:hypothetical protein [Larkinella soli]|uniref:hypothetical protein n=1 Tax=Larkinella soli TaxID=1770527 RepID=UPI000FFCBA74|nr:hypothetical protein [Larkinella soli]
MTQIDPNAVWRLRKRIQDTCTALDLLLLDIQTSRADMTLDEARDLYDELGEKILHMSPGSDAQTEYIIIRARLGDKFDL